MAGDATDKSFVRMAAEAFELDGATSVDVGDVSGLLVAHYPDHDCVARVRAAEAGGADEVPAPPDDAELRDLRACALGYAAGAPGASRLTADLVGVLVHDGSPTCVRRFRDLWRVEVSGPTRMA